MAAALSPTILKEAEFLRRSFRVVVDNDVTIEDLRKPEFWVHVAVKLQNTDLIEVVPKDESWFALLIVRSASRIHAKCEILLSKNFGAQPEKAKKKEDPKFKIEHKGNDKRWTVIRKADKAIAKDGFNTEEEAAAWLEDNRNDLDLA